MGFRLSGAGLDILKGDIGRKRRKGDSSDIDQDAMHAFNSTDGILSG